MRHKILLFYCEEGGSAFLRNDFRTSRGLNRVSVSRTQCPRTRSLRCGRQLISTGFRTQSSATRSCSALLPGWLLLANAACSMKGVLGRSFGNGLLLGIGLSIRKNLNMLSNGGEGGPGLYKMCFFKNFH